MSGNCLASNSQKERSSRPIRAKARAVRTSRQIRHAPVARRRFVLLLSRSTSALSGRSIDLVACLGDRRFTDLRADELRYDPPPVEDEYPVADRRQLLM